MEALFELPDEPPAPVFVRVAIRDVQSPVPYPRKVDIADLVACADWCVARFSTLAELQEKRTEVLAYLQARSRLSDSETERLLDLAAHYRWTALERFVQEQQNVNPAIFQLLLKKTD